MIPDLILIKTRKKHLFQINREKISGSFWTLMIMNAYLLPVMIP